MAQKQKKKSQAPKQLKFAVAAAVTVLFFLGLIQIIQGFIDTRNYTDEIVEAIQKQTNRKVTIKGNVTVSLLPVPTLFIPGIELRDAASDKPAPALTIDMVSIQVPFLSVFSKNISISSIALSHPVLELVRADDNLIYWDWLSADLLKALSESSASTGGALAIVIGDGKILYHDNRTEKSFTVDNIDSVITNGKKLNAGGSFQIAGHVMNYTVNTSIPTDPNNKSDAPFSLKVTSGGKDALEVQGNLNVSGDLPDLKGTFSLKLENAPDWVQAVKPKETHLFQQVTNQFSNRTETKTMLPLKITSKWMEHGLSVTLGDLILEGLGSGGAGKIEMTWTDWKPNVLMNMQFSGISYDQWSLLITKAFTKSDTDTIVYHEINEAMDNPIPDNINLNVNMKAEQVFFGQQVWKDAQVSAHIGGGAVTVNQCNLKLQGESTVSIFGVISPSTTSDLRFEGSMETSGKSLRKMLTVFDETAADLPETGFGDFFAHSNMFISSTQLRLSEADVKLGDLHLNGGLVAYFDTNPRIEADIKLKNINFDYFRDVWRDKQKNSEKQEDFFLKFDKTTNFTWLKKLQTAIDFKVVVKHFTFLERKGENASFRLYAKSGGLGLYDINFIYPNDITKGHFRIDVNGEQPAITLNLTTNDLNTDYFSVEPYKPDPADLPPGFPKALDAKNEPVSASDTASVMNELSKLDASSPAMNLNVDAIIASKLAASSPAAKEIVGPPITADAATSPAAKPTVSASGVASALDASAPAVKPVVSASGVANALDASAPAAKPAVTASGVASALDASAPATKPIPDAAATPVSQKADDAKKYEIKPQAQTFQIAEDIEPSKPISGLDELVKHKDKSDPYFAGLNKKNWSEKLWDMSWLGGYSGEFEINVNHLIHKNISLGNLRLKTSFGNDQILFKTFSFSYWGGQCSMVGSLYGGKVPGFSISFTVVNAQVQQLLASLTNRHNISGQVSVSATMSSSGVNMLSWVSQAEGKIVMIGRNIYVQGLNIQGVIDSVAISRTSSDVLSSVNRALFNGDTILSVDGNLNIKDGLIRTPGIGLRTATSMGNLMGELRLVPWTLELSALFQFPSMSQETIPTLKLQYSGNPDAGEVKTDTSSLESFVAKRIISQ